MLGTHGQRAAESLGLGLPGGTQPWQPSVGDDQERVPEHKTRKEPHQSFVSETHSKVQSEVMLVW